MVEIIDVFYHARWHFFWMIFWEFEKGGEGEKKKGKREKEKGWKGKREEKGREGKMLAEEKWFFFVFLCHFREERGG